MGSLLPKSRIFRIFRARVSLIAQCVTIGKNQERAVRDVATPKRADCDSLARVQNFSARSRFAEKRLPGKGSESAAWCQPPSEIFAGSLTYMSDIKT